MLKDLIMKNRSYRRFHEDVRITREQLAAWVDLARLSGSARNAQSMRYFFITSENECNQVFPLLGWAGYLSEWQGPAEGERPAAYIVILNDRDVSTNYYCDDGIAAQSVMLGACEAGYGGCLVASVKRQQLRDLFKIDERYDILLVLALGKPAETVVIEEMKNADYKYWRDEYDIHHVPKRALSDLILKNERS